MLLKSLSNIVMRRTRPFAAAQIGNRMFSQNQLVNHETDQPPVEGTVSDYYLDTKMANSKYYNPHTFDPQLLEYQEDVRLLTRDEIPQEIEASDIAENLLRNFIPGQ